jgi:uncharacterized membrane protein YbhN (UPF0104 family)
MALFTRWGPRPHIRTLAFLLAGVVLFLVLIWRVGPTAVGSLLLTVGWSVLLLPFPALFAFVFETVGWWYAFSRGGSPLPFATLLRFNVAVKFIQGVTPSVSQAGELAKLHLLIRAGVGADLATASLVTGKTTIAAAELVFIVLGSIAALGYVAIDPVLKMWILVGVLFLAVALAGVLAWQWLGVFGPVVRLGRRLPVLRGFFERHQAWLLSTDVILKEYLVKHQRRFWASTLGFFAFWWMGGLETWLVVWMMGLPATVSAMVFIHVWLCVVTRLTAFVPAHLGTFEAGAMMAFAMVGLPAEGALAYALLRRIRHVVWIGAGLATWPGSRSRTVTTTMVETSSLRS